MRNDLRDREKILYLCDGVNVKEKENNYGYINRSFYKVGDIKVPTGIFIKVISTTTKGTIGRLVDIDVKTTERVDDNGDKIEYINSYDITYIIEIDGRNKPSRINSYHADVLDGYTGPTLWVRNIKTHDKEKIPNPRNKFKQELKKGDWIIGVGTGYKANKPLRIGKVSRWTKSTVWAETIDGEEFKLNSIRETFLLPLQDESLDDSLMMAIVKGWDGR